MAVGLIGGAEECAATCGLVCPSAANAQFDRTIAVEVIDQKAGKSSTHAGFTPTGTADGEMIKMAEPYRHPDTGVYYLRRQIPQAVRIEFGGKALWKRSLETKDAVEARRRFAAVNAELEARF